MAKENRTGELSWIGGVCWQRDSSEHTMLDMGNIGSGRVNTGVVDRSSFIATLARYLLICNVNIPAATH